MSAELHHPFLGIVRGRAGDGVVQYLGVKYALLRDRFAEPELCTSYGSKSLDATFLGPSVVSPPLACQMEHGLIQHSLPLGEFSISDIDGLNLNISVPITRETRLPVFVFIHGGGFNVGSNAWPQYDFSRIVKLSAEEGLPVIGVSINYRLGVLGFLSSNELREAGYKANNGIRDQRTALLWIKRNIAGFGGDPQNVTIGGESAGGVSCLLHLHSPEPLFKRLVSIAGTSLLTKPLPPSVSEATYRSVLQSLGLEDLAVADRLKAMLSIPVESFYEKVSPAVPLLPVIDDELIPGMLNFHQISTDGIKVVLPGTKWCESLLIGDCKFDGNIFTLMLGQRKVGISRSFITSLTATLREHPAEIKAVLEAYGILPDTTDDAGLVGILRFATDIGFYAPAIAFARGWPWSTNVYVYHFNQPNPWDGPFKGEATHILDVAFLFQNYNEYLSGDEKAVAKAFAEHLIKFVNGKEPFPVFTGGKGGAMVYGPPADGATFIEGSIPEDVGRSSALINIAERIGYDLLAKVWNNFLASR